MKYIFFIFSIIVAVSCSTQYEFAEYKGVKETGWKATDTLVYDIKINNTHTPYNISLAVRHNKNYEFDNIWFKIFGQIINKNPNGKMVEIILFDKMGKPYGK
jgi:gliding motility-associated lipoprotein GldH